MSLVAYKAGKPLEIALGDAGWVSYKAYDWNRPATINLLGGSSLNFSYDGLQQVSIITGKDPADNPVIDYQYGYSASGNVSKKATEHGDYSYGYDTLYRLTSAESPQQSEAFSYDAVGNRTSSSTITGWSYNDNNQL